MAAAPNQRQKAFFGDFEQARQDGGVVFAENAARADDDAGNVGGGDDFLFGKEFGVGVVVDEVSADEGFGDFVLVEVVEIDAGRGNVYQLADMVVPHRR